LTFRSSGGCAGCGAAAPCAGASSPDRGSRSPPGRRRPPRHLRGAARALQGVQAPRPLRHPAGGTVPRRDLPTGPARRAQGGCAGRLGLHRARRARAAVGDARDARIARGLARARVRPDRPRAGSTAAGRCRRRAGSDQAVEQCWPASGPPALLCPSRAQPAGQLPERERERVPQAYWQALDDATDERDGNRDSKRSSTSSAVPTTPPRACPGWPLVHRRAVPDRRAKALLAITRLLAQLLALVPRRLRPLDRAGMTSALRRWRSVDISRPAAAPTGYR
jgi:hypothetical protein